MKAHESTYNPSEIEPKWQKKWESDNIFSPDITAAKNPYFNLMMFPYPSAEGLHVGNMYAFTGADVYARFNRMQGKDVLEPIGLDGFGIHSENYALKVGRHPKEQAQIAEKNFYRQLRSIGNSFDWQRTVETYNPDYYKWTQWLFIQLFKAGLAYRDTALVNWCPKDLTVLSDEQVIDGKCERCGTEVEKRDLEQWFFRITKYADRLLQNIEGLKWSEKVKIAQRNWIGKSEGAEVEFEVTTKFKYIFIHGHNGGQEKDFWQWLKKELEKRGSTVEMYDLPTNGNPDIETQVNFLLEKHTFDSNTVVVTHSLGGDVGLKLLPRIKTKIHKLIMVAPPLKPEFLDGVERPELTKACDWEFDFEAVKEKAKDIIVLEDIGDDVIISVQPAEIASKLGAKFVEVTANTPHFNTKGAEPAILNEVVERLKVFTTRPDTLFGATFMVIAPEHEIVQKLVHGSFEIEENIRDEVSRYVEKTKSKTEIERTGEGKEKTGVFSGLYAINPVNDEKIPVWVADYVLSGYGTGAIMAVPAHDSRDFEFAKKYNLPIVEVIKSNDEFSGPSASRPHPTASLNDVSLGRSTGAPRSASPIKGPYEGPGVLVNSGEWNGLEVPKEMGRVLDFLEEKGLGKRRANYHLRDWLISRQRYWGPPIPMIFCSTCQKNSEFEVEGMNGWFTVPQEELPVLLPDVEDWKPMGTGKSPLANHPEFYKTTCPHCGGEAMRETDVSDTFLDSSWYFLRYPNTDVVNAPFDTERTKKWLPVDQYIGGAEHSVLHLLYSRFVTMVLKDLNFLDFEEPFTNFFAHGLIIKDGAKMSKSKGNVVVPDEYISKYGADTLRTYLMFLGPYSDGGDFRDSGIEGMHRFIRKVWKLLSGIDWESNSLEKERLRMMHKTIQGVTKDIRDFGYNTAIAKLMEWYNYLNAEVTAQRSKVSREEAEVFLKLLAPFAPHMTEELWQKLGLRVEGLGFSSIHLSKWPELDEKQLQTDIVLVIVQVNGKKRGEFELESGKLSDQKEAEKRAFEAVSKHTGGVQVKKVIYIPGKILNIVI